MKDNIDNEFNKAMEEAKAKFADNPDMQELYITRRLISIVAKDMGLTDKEFIDKYIKSK